jgi:charged multivesicular body protein 4
MFSWFTKKKEEKIVGGTREAIDGMQKTIDDLEKREHLLEKKIEEEVEKARTYVKQNNRTAAGECIKKKKKYEEQIKRLQQQKENLETQILQVESSTLDVEVLKSQQNAAKTLKNAHGGMTVDDVEKQLDEVRDAMEASNDIGRALSQSIGGGEILDEDELEDELQGLQDELDVDELAALEELSVSKTKLKTSSNGVKTTTTTKTAVAVTTKTKKKLSEEEEELARMEAEMMA